MSWWRTLPGHQQPRYWLTLSIRLHPGRCVDCVTKQTIARHLQPHHPGHNRTYKNNDVMNSVLLTLCKENPADCHSFLFNDKQFRYLIEIVIVLNGIKWHLLAIYIYIYAYIFVFYVPMKIEKSMRHLVEHLKWWEIFKYFVVSQYEFNIFAKVAV